MEIERDIFKQLLEWKESASRRPLLIQGARQIGKTWVMKKFGERYYSSCAYFNFDSDEELKKEFENTKKPDRLIQLLSLYTEVEIRPHHTLIIFDEIQECPEALNSIKYFCEDAPDYHVMAAGSLLGVAIHRHKGFPVGKVDFLRMYPLTFREYLHAISPKPSAYLDSMTEWDSIPAIIESTMWEAYRQYQVCGGMPKAAVASIENVGQEQVISEQQKILTSYYLDFSKHAPASVFPRIAAIWKSLPSQLSKENRKFIYKAVRPGARAREYEDALSWLNEAGLIYEIFRISKPGLPLSAFDDLNAFKIYLLDVGLLRELADLPPTIFTTPADNFVEFKGALAENTVLENLLPTFERIPRYWVSNGTAEVDFVLQNGLDIIPIEVKSSTNASSRSLSVYIKKYSPRLAIVISGKPLAVSTANETTTVLNIPLPLTPWLPQIIDRLLGKQE